MNKMIFVLSGWMLTNMALAESFHCRLDAVVSFAGSYNHNSSPATRVVNLDLTNSVALDDADTSECQAVEGRMLQWKTAPSDLKLGDDLVVDAALIANESGMIPFSIESVQHAFKFIHVRADLKTCISTNREQANQIEIWKTKRNDGTDLINYNLTAWEGGFRFERSVPGGDLLQFETSDLMVQPISADKIRMTVKQLGIWDDVLVCR